MAGSPHVQAKPAGRWLWPWHGTLAKVRLWYGLCQGLSEPRGCGQTAPNGWKGLKRCMVVSSGAVSVETVIVLPLLLWALVATVVFFDGFRTRTAAVRAAEVVADLVSRETEAFSQATIERMNEVFDFLANARHPTRLRVSVLMWNSALDEHIVHCSLGTRGLAPLPPKARLRHSPSSPPPSR